MAAQKRSTLQIGDLTATAEGLLLCKTRAGATSGIALGVESIRLGGKALLPSPTDFEFVIGPEGLRVVAPIACPAGPDTLGLPPAATQEKPAAAKRPSSVVAGTTINGALVAEWQERLVRRINADAGKGQPLQALVRIDGKPRRLKLVAADEKDLQVEVNGNAMPLRWNWFSPADRASLVKSFAAEDNVEEQLMLAVFLQEAGQTGGAEEALARAGLADADAAAALREALKMPSKP